jgi:hypothetical protein
MRLAAVALLTAACATGSIPRVPGDPPPAVRDAEAERDYQALLDRSTQSAGVYDNLDSKVFFRAVYQSSIFRQARVHREAMFKDMPSQEESKRQGAERERLAQATEFFMGVHSNDYRFEDFSRPDTMWRLVLVVNGTEYVPTSIERLGRTSTEMRSYYSWMESFWVGYRIRFPKVELPAGQTFHFHLASALGKADLAFQAE